MIGLFLSFLEEFILFPLSLILALSVVIVSIYYKIKKKELPVIGLVFSEMSLFLILSLFISAFVIPSPSSCRIDTSCLVAYNQVSVLDEGYTCYNSMDNISVQISRGSGEFDLKDVQIIFESETETITFSLLNKSTTFYPSDVDISDLPTLNNIRVYRINATNAGFTTAPETVKIAAVLKSGKSEIVCDASGAIVLKAC